MEEKPTSFKPTTSQPVERQVGEYELVQMLGRGGMAEVWKAYQPSLDRYVAVKLILPQLASDPDFIERFRREAQAAAKLVHPNIVQVYSFNESAGQFYLVMELIEGHALQDEIEKGLIAPGRVQEILEQIGSALELAHANNIIHRDIKPTNILLTGPKRAVLSDFGVAKMLDRTTKLTASFVSIGTPEYMAPEQFRGKPLDGRSDQYSLAVLTYKMLTSQTPFEAPDYYALTYAVVNEPPVPPSQYNAGINPMTEKVMLKALSKEPNQRFNSVTDFVRAFLQTLNEELHNISSSANKAKPTTQMLDVASIFPNNNRDNVAKPSIYSTVRETTPASQPRSIPDYFGFKGIPGHKPLEQEKLSPLPAPLPRRGRIFWICTIVILFLLGVATAVAALVILNNSNLERERSNQTIATVNQGVVTVRASSNTKNMEALSAANLDVLNATAVASGNSFTYPPRDLEGEFVTLNDEFNNQFPLASSVKEVQILSFLSSTSADEISTKLNKYAEGSEADVQLVSNDFQSHFKELGSSTGYWRAYRNTKNGSVLIYFVLPASYAERYGVSSSQQNKMLIVQWIGKKL